MADLAVRVLGELSVRRDGVDVQLPPSKKTRALLAYLTVLDRPQRRERLCEMFWELPDDPRGALRWSLSKLRQIVNTPSAQRLQADRNSVFIDKTGIDLDLAAVEPLAKADLARCELAELERAAASFRGFFLDELALPRCPEFEAWRVAYANEMEILRLRLLRQLVERLRDEPDRALPYAHALQALLPDDAYVAADVSELAQAARHGILAAAPVVPSAAQRPPGAPPGDDPAGHGAAAIPAGASQVGDLFHAPAVAVLPFSNLSGDPEQAFFSDGITDDVITALCYWRWFPVIAGNSTAAFAGSRRTVQEIGRELAARYVVEGGVQRAGERLRLTVHLTDAETGHQIWSQRYDRRIGDMFELQDELAGAIVTAIEPQISQAEQRRARARRVDDLDAWELSQRALWHIRRATDADYAEARRLLENAVERAPTYGYPRTLLAFCLFYQAVFGWTRDPPGAFAAVLDAAAEAVHADDGDWLGHALLGIAHLWTSGRHDLARESAARALELNPSASLAHHFYSCICVFTGEFEEALASQQALFRLDPDYSFASVILADMALEHLLMDNLDEAIRCAHAALGRQPSNVRALQRLLAALGLKGDAVEAARWREQLLTLQPDLSLAYIDSTYPFQQPGHRRRFLEGLRRAGLDFTGLAPAPADDAAQPAAPQAELVAKPKGIQEVRFCTTCDGVQLAYATTGSGPPLVRAAHWLSHLQFDWESPVWRHWIDGLSAECTLVRYDERANGLSDWNVDDLSFEAMITDLESIVDAAGLDRFILLGVSQGCAISVAYAVRHPERVSGLILYGGYVRGWRRRGNAAENAQREAMATLAREGWGQDNPVFRQLFTNLFIPGADNEQIAWFNELQRRTVSPDNAYRLLQTFADIDVADLLPQVRAPTLVMHARLDAVAPYDFGKALAAGIPGARFVELESANHILLQQEPAFGQFLDELRSFVREFSARPDLQRAGMGGFGPANIVPLERKERLSR